MIVVVPPCNAAWLTRAGPSVIWCWVVPGTTIGQRQWTCGSIPPGMTICPDGIDSPPGADRGEAARRADRGDLAAGDADIDQLRAGGKNGEPARDDDVQHLLPFLFAPLVQATR